MVTLKEKIKFLVSELAEKERDKENNHKWSSISPGRNSNERDNYQRILNALARLLTGNETCAAIYMSKGGKGMIIASNSFRPDHACKYMKNLSCYANQPTEENYFMLLGCALENACQEILQFEDKVSLFFQDLGNWTNFKNYLFKIAHGEISWPSTKEEGKKIAELAKSAFAEKSTEKSLTDGDRYLCTFHDTYNIASFLESYSKSRSDLQICGRRKSLFELISSNSENGIFYGNSDYGEDKSDMHAEMKILTMLRSQNYLEQERGYIGISKLCCVPCQFMLDIINEKSFAQREKKFSNHGNHGGTYPGGIVTDFFQKELLQKIETLVTRKARESTSEVPDYFQMVLQHPK